ncbi:MAG: hypothetical protein EOP47_07440 [Sphingobacteriaceae bacterium]|nr:MAG: hypothetical protein EOP47_07440 [Sphingobacteriaceae bacterium]
MNNKRLFILSIITVVFFSLLFLNAYVLKSEYVLIGVIHEMTTIPMLLFLAFLVYFSVKFSLKDRFSIKKASFWSLAMLICLVVVLVGSFIP